VSRETSQAEILNNKGLNDIEDGDFDRAEANFRHAIEKDLYYAPAHNNLGLVLLKRERYYEAAWEFDSAAKLAPAEPEPWTNLGRLYERLGRMDQAVSEYEAALKLSPENFVAMRHLARAYVKAEHRDDRLKRLLERLLLIPGDVQWDAWARGQLIRLGRASDQEPVAGVFPPTIVGSGEP
jgi:Tfp pilus assembly protein PilF